MKEAIKQLLSYNEWYDGMRRYVKSDTIHIFPSKGPLFTESESKYQINSSFRLHIFCSIFSVEAMVFVIDLVQLIRVHLRIPSPPIPLGIPESNIHLSSIWSDSPISRPCSFVVESPRIGTTHKTHIQCRSK